jgi:hypothetical protein
MVRQDNGLLFVMLTGKKTSRRRYRMDRRRVAWRFARGLGVEQVADLERLELREVAGLWCEESFQRLIRDCEALSVLPPEQRRERALEAAWRIIFLSLARGNIGVALYIKKEMAEGRDPGESMAKKVLALLEKTWAAVPAPVPPHPGAVRPPAVRPSGQGSGQGSGQVSGPVPAHFGAAVASMIRQAQDILIGEAAIPTIDEMVAHSQAVLRSNKSYRDRMALEAAQTKELSPPSPSGGQLGAGALASSSYGQDEGSAAGASPSSPPGSTGGSVAMAASPFDALALRAVTDRPVKPGDDGKERTVPTGTSSLSSAGSTGGSPSGAADHKKPATAPAADPPWWMREDEHSVPLERWLPPGLPEPSELERRVGRLVDRSIPKDRTDLDLAEAICSLKVPDWPRYRGTIDLHDLALTLERFRIDLPTLRWLASTELENEVRRTIRPKTGVFWPQAP